MPGLYANTPDSEGYTNEAQYEANPLLDNNNRPGWTAYLLTFLLPRRWSGTPCALVVEISDMSVNTAGGAVPELNRISAVGHQSSAWA